MGARSVLGNHDGAAIGTVDPHDFNPEAAIAIRWTASVLDDNARAYLSSLPEVRREGDLTAVHGSPRDPIWEYITSTSIAMANLDAFETRLCLFGHTHLPIAFAAQDGRGTALAALPDEPVALETQRMLLNPGSVGQPRDGNPASSYLVLDTDANVAEFHRVAYDIAETQRLMRQVDLPTRLVERLSWGR
jgi:diadenosine tetraphosphatase ApaH/serine/threonine PP2A family protein phosphatase